MPQGMPATSGISVGDFELTPSAGPEDLYKPAQTRARTDATLLAAWLGTVLFLISVVLLAVGSRVFAFAISLSFVALVVGVYVLVWNARTKVHWNRLYANRMDAAKMRLRVSLETIERSKTLRSQITRVLRNGEAVLAEAESEMFARRFAVFWDRIEQAAKILANARLGIDELRTLQANYLASLQGYVHNLPVVLPGCTTIPSDAATVDRYYRLVQQAQCDIDFALIWEHRQTRAVMIAGFTTIGDMVQHVGRSVTRSLDLLIAVEAAPRVGVMYAV